MDRHTGLHGYSVALFDVLGFEAKLERLGLAEILRRYEELIARIEAREAHMSWLFQHLGFHEAPYWNSSQGLFIFNKIQGAYASDTLLLWSNRTWPEARTKTPEELEELSKDASIGWQASPVPTDNFLEECNELMCHALEVGLPLRGAVSMGQGVFDGDRRLFLGAPLVEVARMESAQEFIGAGLCKAFREQIIPKRYYLEFEGHLKEGGCRHWGGAVLDWPRHWRNTRRERLEDVVKALDTSPDHSVCYRNTLKLIEFSAQFADQHQEPEDMEIRNQYPEFAFSKDLALARARALRRVPIGEDWGMLGDSPAKNRRSEGEPV